MQKPRIIINRFFVFSTCLLVFFALRLPVYSNNIAELENEITQKENEIKEKTEVLTNVEKRIKEISGSNYSISQKINLLNTEIKDLESSIEEKDKEVEEKVLAITEKQDQLAKVKILLDDVSSTLYMQSRNKLSNFFLNVGNWDSFVEGIFIMKSTITVLKGEVEKIAGEFSSLTESKADLDREKEDLDNQRAGLDEAYKLLASEKAKLQSELSKQVASKSGLSSEITDLTKKVSQLQAALIAARSAGLISSGGYTGSEDGTSISQAPAGYFGVFSIGAYTHRNGMSQWGAKARADAGQSYIDILNFYYGNPTYSNSTMSNITVLYCASGSSCPRAGYSVEDGCINPSYATYDFETDYLYRLGEMPEYFHIEALKAQAIAARTYALRVTGNGASAIRADTCHQYVAGLKTGTWKQAVDATRNQVLFKDGALAITQYAAVHGGWIGSIGGWDTQSGGGGNWFYDAWERVSGVTWFYKSWYRAGSDPAGTNCGHSPWLSPQEMVDMVNAYMIKNNIGVKGTPDKSRLLPSDFGICPGRLDYGNTTKTPYTSSELKSFLLNPVGVVYSVATSLANGSTTEVSFNTDKGVINISGFAFKDIYNQMAPGHMRIQQQSHYWYFNVEKK